MVHRRTRRDHEIEPLPDVDLSATPMTITERLGNGCPPGKRLLGIRAARLDGPSIRLRDAFDRAGGYAAILRLRRYG